MTDVNQETITGTLSWYQILVLSGSNLIRSKQRLRMRRKNVKILGAVIQAKSHLFTLTCQRNLENHVRHSMELSNFDTSSIRDKWLAERAVRRVKGGTSGVLLQSGLDKRWLAGSIECCCYRKMSKLSWQVGKLHMEDDLATHSKDHWYLSKQLLNIIWWLRDQARKHQFDKKVLPGIFLALHWSREEFGKEILWFRIWKNWEIWTHQKFSLEGSTKKKRQHKKDMIWNSQSQVVQRNCREETTNSENPHQKREPTVRSEKIIREIKGDFGESRPT